jgi:DNA-binding MurR/RpiR family transcriptional regulator
VTTATKPDQLLLRFRAADTANGISRSTVVKLAEYLGFTGETQVIHYALRKLAREVLPAYEADDGELTPAQLAAIRRAVAQGGAKSVKSSLF